MARLDQHMSPLEWEIMDVIWQFDGTPSVRDIFEAAYPQKEKAYTTVQTVMNNLVQKGFLQKDKIGMVNFYKPLKKRQEIIAGETGRFVDKVFSGSFQALANYLLHSDSLSKKDIEDIKELIERKENELGEISDD